MNILEPPDNDPWMIPNSDGKGYIKLFNKKGNIGYCGPRMGLLSEITWTY